MTRVYNAPLLSLTIAGNVETMLTVTFTRARSALTTDLGSAAERQTVTAQRGVAHACDEGSLVGMVKQDLRTNDPKHINNDYNVVGYRQSSMGPQIVRMRRDVEGGLVGRTQVRKAREFMWQAGSGKGVPYWFDINIYWTDWMAMVATPVPTPNDGLAPEKRRSIKRQVYEQENGVGSYAAATANGELPNPSTTLPRAVTSRADMRTMVARHIDSNATLADVRREDDRTC